MPTSSTSTTPFITFIPAGVAPIANPSDSDADQRVMSDPNYPAFQDAMDVREKVFVKEQGVPFENELDEDDYRSFHWVVYASVASTGHGAQAHRGYQHHHHHGGGAGGAGGGSGGSSTTRIPVGTIRLIPPPHASHMHQHQLPSPESAQGNGHQRHHPDSPPPTSPHEDNCNYIKLGRLATIPAFRGLGIGKLLVDTALQWAADHPDEVMGDVKWNRRISLSGMGITEQMRKAAGAKREGEGVVASAVRGGELGAFLATGKGWDGKVLVHAQKAVKGMWEKFGFVLDESMGEWDEEGIVHVGLWKQIHIKKPA
ncbi:hypothetical protein BDZ91DRAFT_790179 [Kalaharituber pfeilii]|nr:hypothetical protein BDZ91DRAFT_790179 [Kalaharituber pfeilii]